MYTFRRYHCLAATYVLPKRWSDREALMPKLSLAARTVLNLKPPTDGQVDYYDDDRKAIGFGLRMAASGHGTWFFLYRSPTRSRNGKRLQCRITIGTHPAMSVAKARAKARQYHLDVENDIDPGEVKQEKREAGTFEDLALDFLKRYRKKNGARKISADEDERLIRKELLPEWRYRKANAITRQDVRDLVTVVAEGTGRKRPAPILANRILVLISTIFNWALREGEGRVESNPAHLIGRLGVEAPRERVLTEDELRRVWAALARETADHRAFYRFAIATAQRTGGKRDGRGELLRMKWTEVDDASHWWTIPGTRTKNGKPNRVYLTVTAREQLAEMRAYQSEQGIASEYVFATTRTTGEPAPASGRTIERVRVASGVAFRPHDLRRTAATMLTAHGEPLAIVGKLLNHTESGVTATVYDQYTYSAEVQRAFEHWERILTRIVSPETQRGADVLPMRGRAS
jgi:integrase